MKKTIIIAVVVLVIIAIGAGVFLFLQNNSAATNTATQTGGNLPVQTNSTTSDQGGAPAAPTTLSLDDTQIPLSDITALPSDVPQSPTIQFQTASGTITLKNFYPAAKGYWAPLDLVLLENNPSYTIWYYRDSSEFEIDIPLSGTSSDADAGAAQLANDLGVSKQSLCGLPVTASFIIDRGMDSQTYPLDFCSQSAL